MPSSSSMMTPRRKFFQILSPIDFQTAIHLALGRINRDNVETSWSDALVNAMGDTKPYTFEVEEGMMMERRTLLLDLPADSVFRAYTGIGGTRWLDVYGLGVGHPRLDG